MLSVLFLYCINKNTKNMEHTKYWSDRCKLAEHIVFKSVVENKNEKVGRALDKYETFLEIKGCKDYVK